MKKICFITTVHGTLRSFVVNTAKYLYEKGGYDITFICNYDKQFKEELPDFIHYIPVNMKRGISFSAIKSTFELYKIFKKERFDMIQYSTPNASLYSSIAGKMARVRIRLYCQWGIRYVGFSGFKRALFKMIEKIICNKSTWIEPDSYGNLRFSYEEGLYSKEKSSVVWNGSAAGVDISKFDINKKQLWREEIRSKYKIDKDTKIIGFVGRLDKDKGIDEVFESTKKIFQKHENIKLFIVGHNDKPDTINKELFKWAKENSNVIFTGRVSNVEKYYAAMDIFMLPSYREGFGSVVVEAEAMGVPVIVTNIPGPTDAMIEGKTGLVVKKANSGELGHAILKMIEDEEMRKKMSEEAIFFARNKFNSQELFKHILDDRNRLFVEGRK